MQVLRNAALPVSRWPNGAGRKADLASGEGWTVSFAWLDADAPFSELPGVDRTITLVEGPGFTLDIGGRALTVAARGVPAGFDGGAAAYCRIAGPSRVLNAMTARGRFRHEVVVRRESGVVDPGGAAACFVVALGAATVGEVSLGPLDAVRLERAAELVLPVAGCAAVVTVSG